MITRVLEHYDSKLGIPTYEVQKWALWDTPDLRKYYPDVYDWRYCAWLADREKAVQIAERLSKGDLRGLALRPDYTGGETVHLVVASFGGDQ